MEARGGRVNGLRQLATVELSLNTTRQLSCLAVAVKQPIDLAIQYIALTQLQKLSQEN